MTKKVEEQVVTPEVDTLFEVQTKHREMVLALCKKGDVIAEELTAHDTSLINLAMEIDKHTSLVLMYAPIVHSVKLSGIEAHLTHMAIGLSGESGELLDAIKRATIYRKELDLANVTEECGDLLFYAVGYLETQDNFEVRQTIQFVLQLGELLGISHEQMLQANIDKLAKRYEGFKYSDQAAQDRADKS